MGEMMAMMRDPHKLTNQTINTTITTVYPSWKLYENPYYYSQQQHCLHLPHSAHKIASSLWDLIIFRPIMDSELDIARAQITELKAELEFERKVRKKVEALNRKLNKEISEEKKMREAMERVCEKLAKEIASDKAEIDRMKKEMEEERKMLRMAEVLREERVQMKLTEAKILLEEKISELELSKMVKVDEASVPKVEQKLNEESTTMGSCENSNFSNNCVVRSSVSKRRASPEAENPHIKRGIKGFVEFPRVVRAISSRGRQTGSKLECQKAQLRFLLRQKSPIRADNLIMG